MWQIINVGFSIDVFAKAIALSTALISLPSLTSKTSQLDAMKRPLTDSEKDSSNPPSRVTSFASYMRMSLFNF